MCIYTMDPIDFTYVLKRTHIKVTPYLRIIKTKTIEHFDYIYIQTDTCVILYDSYSGTDSVIVEIKSSIPFVQTFNHINVIGK
jgi:hypothetical protein